MLLPAATWESVIEPVETAFPTVSFITREPCFSTVLCDFRQNRFKTNPPMATSTAPPTPSNHTYHDGKELNTGFNVPKNASILILGRNEVCTGIGAMDIQLLIGGKLG